MLQLLSLITNNVKYPEEVAESNNLYCLTWQAVSDVLFEVKYPNHSTTDAPIL